MLQVLLSPTHRHRALLLLGRFVALGAWAVGEMLLVGIFPYILKLLLSAAAELRPPLLFIWAKVQRRRRRRCGTRARPRSTRPFSLQNMLVLLTTLARTSTTTQVLLHDPSCQTDLQRDAAHAFFVDILRNAVPSSPPSPTAAAPLTPPVSPQSSQQPPPISPPLHCVLALLVLTIVCHNQPEGRAACLRHELPAILSQLIASAIPEPLTVKGTAATEPAAEGESASVAASASAVNGTDGGDQNGERSSTPPPTSLHADAATAAASTASRASAASNVDLASADASRSQLLLWCLLCVSQLSDHTEAAQQAAAEASIPQRLLQVQIARLAYSCFTIWHGIPTSGSAQHP